MAETVDRTPKTTEELEAILKSPEQYQELLSNPEKLQRFVKDYARHQMRTGLQGKIDEALHDGLKSFLMRGDVFSKDLVETWLDWKRTNEIDEVRVRPHPYEFALYYDC